MYATQQDLVDRFGERELIQLTDRDHTGEIDATVIDLALEDAASKIEGYLRVRYRLPLPEVPRSLTRIACDLARYYLHEEAPTETVENRHKDAVRYLEHVSAGKINLDIDPPASTAGEPLIHKGSKEFNDIGGF